MPSEGPVILTGAASGIGRATAQALAAKAHALALVDINPEMLNQVVEICQKSSARTRGFTCDVTDAAAVTQTWQRIRSEFGRAATLINCAGIGRFAPFLEIEPAEWLRMFSVNVMGAVLFTRAVLPDMLAAGKGLIIDVSSRMALDPHPTTTAYAASKAAIHASFHLKDGSSVRPPGLSADFTNLLWASFRGHLMFIRAFLVAALRRLKTDAGLGNLLSLSALKRRFGRPAEPH